MNDNTKAIVTEIANIVRNKEASKTTSDRWLEYHFELGVELGKHLEIRTAREQNYRLKEVEILKTAKNAKTGESEAKTTEEYRDLEEIETAIKVIKITMSTCKDFANQNSINHW